MSHAIVTHTVVRNTPPPRRPVMTVGYYRDLTPQPEAKAVVERVEDEDETGEVEAKVVKRGRRPAAPTVNEGAEVK